VTVVRDVPVDETERALDVFRRTYSASTLSSAITAGVESLVGQVIAVRGRLEAAINHLGARVEASAISEAATLAVEGSRYVIRIRNSDPEARQRFSIAHEIGHVLLFEGVASEPHLIPSIAHRPGSSVVERLCDQAAAELLMPADAFRDGLLSARFDWDHVMRLAAQFQVSHAAALVRVTDVLTGSRIVRFRRDPMTTGRSRQYEPLSTYGREPLRLPTRVRSAEVRPRVLDTADDRGRSVTRRMQLVLRGAVVWESQCVAVRERYGSTSATVAALFQPANVESDAWRVLSAR
jgi:Zn-dependent peptidase ImmA (M78 family)